MTNHIHKSAIVGQKLALGFNVVIMEHVTVGDNVRIGNNVVIYPFTKISDNVEILDNAVIGKLPARNSNLTRKTDQPLSPCEIGEGSTIGTSAIIYAGTTIGKNCLIADQASIREKCIIKDNTIIGRTVTVEYETTIGEYCRIMTHSQITGNMVIEDHVFIGGAVISTNDKYMGRTGNQFNGPKVKSGARIGANATLLAGVIIGRESIIGEGAVVTNDIPDRKVAFGVPARVVKDVSPEQLLECLHLTTFISKNIA